MNQIIKKFDIRVTLILRWLILSVACSYTITYYHYALRNLRLNTSVEEFNSLASIVFR